MAYPFMETIVIVVSVSLRNLLSCSAGLASRLAAVSPFANISKRYVHRLRDLRGLHIELQAPK